MFYILCCRVLASRQLEYACLGVDEATIRASKIVAYTRAIGGGTTECVVYPKEFTEGEPLNQLPCEHFFHTNALGRHYCRRATIQHTDVRTNLSMECMNYMCNIAIKCVFILLILIHIPLIKKTVCKSLILRHGT
jgi:hypothetical protein